MHRAPDVNRAGPVARQIGRRDDSGRHARTEKLPVPVTVVVVTDRARIRAGEYVLEDRDLLDSLSLPSGTVSEGDHVRLAGYVSEARAQGAEAVNCYDASQKDIHINIAPKNAGRHQGIVVEMIPQLARPEGWNAATLNRLHKLQLQVLVLGGLTYDNEHRVNDRPTQPIGGQPCERPSSPMNS
jgi:hypothetical protein